MATPAAVRVWGNSFAIYKRIWRSNLLGSLLQPLLYLLGMGVGVGTLVDRGTSSVDVLGGAVRVKVGLREGRIVQATPEFEDAAGLARAVGVPLAHVLRLADASAVAAGLVPGAPRPPGGAS